MVEPQLAGRRVVQPLVAQPQLAGLELVGHLMRPPVGRETAVTLLSAALGVAALGIVAAGAGPAAPVVPVAAAPLLLVTGFALAERFVVHLPLGRQTHAFSLGEIPLVVGLYVADPMTLVAARLVGGAAALAALRVAPLKVLFNLCQWALETAVAVGLWWAIATRGEVLGPAGWLGVLAAVAVVDIVGAATITAVMRLHDGSVPPGAFREAVASGTTPQLANAAFGIAVVTVVAADWRAAWTLLVFVGVLYLAQRAHRTLRQRHDELQRLNAFTGSVVGRRSSDEVAAAVLEQLRAQLACTRAEVALQEPGRRWAVGADDAAPLLPGSADLDLPLLARRGTRDPAQRDLLERTGLRDVMAVRLADDHGPIGTIVVADRLGDAETFTAEDLEVLRALANHAGVALANARLNDQLRREMEANAHRALHDALTGLPNRRSLVEQVDGAGVPVAVLLLDVDRFKEVNDTLGHATGDVLLVALSERLVATVPEARCVARLGGDEFGIALDVGDIGAALRRAGHVRRALEDPFEVAGLSIGVEASLGVAWSAEPEAGALLQQADVAMYLAKDAHTGVEPYSADRDASSHERLLLYTELREAVAADDLVLHFQPKVSLLTGAVTGFEALVRWPHAERGLVPPDRFIPLAEQSGLIHPLTRFVLTEALTRCRAWRAAGHEVGVAVNVAPRSILDADFPGELARLLWQVGLPARALTLEITEGSIMSDPERAIGELERLRRLGVRLSVDDLGTGYSSLAYLKRLPVDEVKIDRSFVRNLAEDPDDEAIVEAVVALGRRLRKGVVAEGVEDAATLERLRELGCDLAQGYHIARPLPAEDVLPWLVARTARPRVVVADA